MSFRFTIPAIVFGLVAAPAIAHAGQPATGSIPQLVSAACAQSDFHGSVLISDSAGRTWFRACGLADRTALRPIDRRTRFKIFSVSKSITALTVLKLESLHKLRVDAPISNYLPAVPASWRPITIEQLLQHTSGLPDLTNELYDRLIASPEVSWSTAFDDVLAHHGNDPRSASSPGSEWKYNNFGYEILARIVERASGRPFAETVQQLLFGPARMRSAYLAQRTDGKEGPKDPLLARGYTCAISRPAEAISHSFVQQGAGAVIATPDDLLALTRYLRSGRFIPLARLRQIMTGAFKATGGAPYGEGFLVRSANGAPYFQHSGGNNGYVAEWAWSLDGQAAAIVLTNSSCADASDLRAALMQLLIHQPLIPASRALHR